jgi:hypothetical protein
MRRYRGRRERRKNKNSNKVNAAGVLCEVGRPVPIYRGRPVFLCVCFGLREVRGVGRVITKVKRKKEKVKKQKAEYRRQDKELRTKKDLDK